MHEKKGTQEVGQACQPRPYYEQHLGRLHRFPDLQSANVAFKLAGHLGGAEAIGPILMGMRKPVHLLQHGSEVKDIVYMTAIAVVDAQEAERQAKGASAEATVPVLR